MIRKSFVAQRGTHLLMGTFDWGEDWADWELTVRVRDGEQATLLELNGADLQWAGGVLSELVLTPEQVELFDGVEEPDYIILLGGEGFLLAGAKGTLSVEQ